jgi:hypothetical protein
MPQSRMRVRWISIVSPSITLACQVGSERRTNFRQQRGDQRYASDGVASVPLWFASRATQSLRSSKMTNANCRLINPSAWKQGFRGVRRRTH